MKSNKVEVFVSSFIIYSIIFLTWNNWDLTGKQIAEMIILGTVSSLLLALSINRLTRLIHDIVRKMKI